ncbi:MAG: UDP-N-acetylmuramoyl-L-alanine--D-glutamate ligase [Rhodospirillaceae bacterium]|nr:UDP-N-acetylmuramoyl-L-alanine--D-glutamate ligase [Rhodospirillaceae bacterium]
MIRIPGYEHKRIAVMGLGVAGLPTARALMASGAEVLAWDDKAESRNAAAGAGVPVVDLLSTDWSGVDTLVLSPGIPHTFPKPHPIAERARRADAAIVCDVDLLGRACPDATYVGITGTNGKSTTTALIAHILAAAGRKLEVGGNLGPAVLNFAPLGRDGIYVLEMSSYQLERTFSIAFDVAVLLNVSPNHIDRHGDLAGYVAAKTRIFAPDHKPQTAIVGVDDFEARRIADALAAEGRVRVVRITRAAPGPGMVGAEGTRLIDRTGNEARTVLDLRDAPDLPGGHNAQNAAAAYAATRALGVAPEIIAAAMMSYRSLPHRLERVGTVDGVLFVNDSKATSPEATVWALTSYPHVYWIAGGLSKGVGYDALVPHLARIRHAFLIGAAADEIAAFLAQHGIGHTKAGTLDRAVASAHAMAKADPDAAHRVVLLSPACASFDQFASFGARGDAFRARVADLGSKP